jgi:methyl-accepting chemotaxis protein
VNAAIEAVKAGEQGLGFSVVAQEIKNMAEQSKQATAQIRSILNDVQKAVNKAVMATEQAARAVDAGSRQAKQSGEVIRILAENINEAMNATAQIAASSQQQLAGMDQIAPAMENIKQTMAQNVASTGQTQLAAQNLHDLGLKLKELEEKFQV